MHVYDIIGLLLGHMIPAVFLQGTQIGVLRALTNNVGQRGMLPITDGRIPDNEDCLPFRLSGAYALCQRRVWTEPLFECSGKMIVFLPFSSFLPSLHPFLPSLLSPPHLLLFSFPPCPALLPFSILSFPPCPAPPRSSEVWLYAEHFALFVFVSCLFVCHMPLFERHVCTGTVIGTAIGTTIGRAIGTTIGTTIGTAIGTTSGTPIGTIIGTTIGTRGKSRILS